jgi:hypothetical protein
MRVERSDRHLEGVQAANPNCGPSYLRPRHLTIEPLVPLPPLRAPPRMRRHPPPAGPRGPGAPRGLKLTPPAAHAACAARRAARRVPPAAPSPRPRTPPRASRRRRGMIPAGRAETAQEIHVDGFDEFSERVFMILWHKPAIQLGLAPPGRAPREARPWPLVSWLWS